MSKFIKLIGYVDHLVRVDAISRISVYNGSEHSKAKSTVWFSDGETGIHVSETNDQIAALLAHAHREELVEQYAGLALAGLGTSLAIEVAEELVAELERRKSE